MTDVIIWIIDVFNAGGWVMYPLLLLSVVSIAATVERCLFWVSPRGGRCAQWVEDAKANANAKDRSVYGQFARDVLADGRDESAVLHAAERQRPRVERFTTLLSTIITGAPMLGILGTVLGIIESFRLLGGADDVVVDPTQIAGGIAKALVTTAFGLAIALLALFPYTLFRAISNRCLARFEILAGRLID